MKLTKYTHSCLCIESDTSHQKLIIDPGSLTTLPESLIDVAVIVVGEEHFDHFSADNITSLLSKNPTARVFSTPTVAESLKKIGIACQAITGNYEEVVGDFQLSLALSDHAPVYGASPCKVLAITVNDFLYCPSDSYTLTTKKIQVLALPTSGPWHKLSEAIDFANAIDSHYIVPTHNGLYNEIGNRVANDSIRGNLNNQDREWVYLKDGESKDFA